jgi:hypothetical protein
MKIYNIKCEVSGFELLACRNETGVGSCNSLAKYFKVTNLTSRYGKVSCSEFISLDSQYVLFLFAYNGKLILVSLHFCLPFFTGVFKTMNSYEYHITRNINGVICVV